MPGRTSVDPNDRWYNIQSSLNYDADDAFLNIKLNFTPPSGNLNNINQRTSPTR